MDAFLTETCIHKTNPDNGAQLELGPDAFAASLTTTVGAIVAGTLANTQAQDGSVLELSETTGNPGYDYTFTFTGVTDTAAAVGMYVRYLGEAVHEVLVQAYNGSTWDTIGNLSDELTSSSYQYVTFDLEAAHTISETVKVRFYHNEAGNTNHKLYFDYLFVNFAITCTPLDPASQQPSQDYPVEKMFLLREFYTKHANFTQGSYATFDGVDYPVRAVNYWPAQGGVDDYYQIIVEKPVGS